LFVVIEADADDFEAFVVKFFVGAFDVRKFGDAGAAPGGPEIDKNDLAFEILEVEACHNTFICLFEVQVAIQCF